MVKETKLYDSLGKSARAQPLLARCSLPAFLHWAQQTAYTQFANVHA
jgi:hypothetical protein